MKQIVIGVDHGNRLIKSREGMYSCGYTVTKNQVGMDMVVEYKGKYYCIDGRTKYKYDKTIDETYFILTLPAIAIRLDREMVSEASIILAIGLPLSHFAQLKDRYIKYFTRANIDFIFNGKHYVANISEVMCFPQSISGYLYNYNEYKDIDFLNLIDVGQMTLDVVKIYNGKPLIESAVSLSCAMNKLVKSIQDNVRKVTGIELSELQIESTLQGKKSIYFKDEIIDLIETTKTDYINEMLDEMRENGFDLQATVNLFIGGGGSIVVDTLDKQKDNNRIGYYDLLPQSQKANVLGYELLAYETLKRR